MVEGPAQFRIVADTARRGLMRRFPHDVYFESTDERVVVLAVVQLHRDPDAWKGPGRGAGTPSA